MDLRTGFAYWLLRNGLLATYPPIERDEIADVAIVGGGITGALAAYELTHTGASVVVVDKRDVASGSSVATTGLLLCETDTSLVELADRVGERSAARTYHLGLEAISRIESLTTSLADSCGFARRSTLYLASTSDDARSLEREYALRRRYGIGVARLDSAEIHRKWGIDASGALYSHGAEIDCYRFAHRLLAAANERGARVFDRTAVQRLDASEDSMMTLTMRGGHRIRAKWVVAALGYEAVEHIQPPKTQLSSTWAFASEPLRNRLPWVERSLIWETARPYLYARTTDDNRIIVGGEDEPYAEGHQDRDLLKRKTARLAARITQWFPQLKFEIAYAWAGTFGSTGDGLPFIGPSPDNPRLWYALGYGGNGITFSAIAARLFVDAYRGRPSTDTSIFALDRPSLTDTLRVT